jgi:cholesterol transport system auxiliary component
MKKSLILLAATLPLSACISFGGKAPPSLLTLTTASIITAGENRSAKVGDAISVAVPTVPQALGSTRVAVSMGQTEIAYIKDAMWAEPPALLFQRLLSETITAKSGKVVIDQKQFSVDAGTQLSGQLKRFGVDAGSNQAVVIYDAALTRDKGKQVMTHRFEARAPVGKIEPVSAARAINLAANDVAREVAEWVGK